MAVELVLGTDDVIDAYRTLILGEGQRRILDEVRARDVQVGRWERIVRKSLRRHGVKRRGDDVARDGIADYDLIRCGR